MGNGRRQNALLVEIIIAVLFFAISATVILEVFTTAYVQTTYADACNGAVAEAQNLAALLYVSDEPEEVLGGEGFVKDDGVWQRIEEEEEDSQYSLRVTLETTQSEAGELRTARIVAVRGEDENVILDIPCARYIPREVSR